MSQIDILNNLKSEASYLKKLIAESPPNAVIGRLSLTARLQSVQQEIKELEETPHPLIQGTISFRGKPVVACRGIEASFGAEAVKKFETIVAAKAASFLIPLSATGKLPNRDQYRLIITGTVRGSFGFEFENRVNDNEHFGGQETSSSLEDAINGTLELFESISDTDEKLADTLVDTDARVVNEVINFLELLANSEATCGLEFGSRAFYFKDVAEIKNGCRRLQNDNLIEKDETICGQFLGVLPHKRLFEFLTKQDKTILSGKISKNTDDPASISSLLNTLVTIGVHTTQVGDSKPKYLLTSLPTPDNEKITAKNSDNVSIVTSQCHTASLYEYGTEKEPALAGVVEGSEDEEN